MKTRANTGGRGAPPITMDSIVINNGHVIVKDEGRLVEDLTRLQMRFGFAYEKPGVAISISQMSANGVDTNVRSLAGDLRFDRGSIVARNLAIDTDRTSLVTTLSYTGPDDRLLDIRLEADRLSLPEIGRYSVPLPTSLWSRRCTSALAGRSRRSTWTWTSCPPPGRREGGRRTFGWCQSVEGRLDVRDINIAPLINRQEWKRALRDALISNGLSTHQINLNSPGRTSRAWIPGGERSRPGGLRTGPSSVRCEWRRVWRDGDGPRNVPLCCCR